VELEACRSSGGGFSVGARGSGWRRRTGKTAWG
jgi:hypothetical protein